MRSFIKTIPFLYFFLFSVLTSLELVAQTAIHNGTGSAADNSAMLDVQGNNTGILIPRVNLTSTGSFAPVVGTAVESLLIYNTNATIGAGYYYWDGAQWVRLMSGNTSPLLGTGLTNKVAFWTNATTLSQNTNFHWDNTNIRLGIGTPNPTVALDVVGRTTATSHISTTGGNLHTNRGRLAFSNTATDPNHSIYNNGSNIDGEGAWDGMKMNVFNGLNIRVGNGGATSAVYVDEVGEVGIGTTDPVEALEIKRTGTNPVQLFHSGGLASYKLGNDGNVFKIAAMDNGYGGHSGNFAANDVQVLSMTTTGNVGVGTTSPSTNLQVHEGTTYNGTALTNTAGRSGLMVSGTYPHIVIASSVNNTNHAGTLSFWHNNNGGTTTTQWNMGASDSGFSIGYTTNNGNPHVGLEDYTTASILSLETNGNVGIGTPTPSGKAHIVTTNSDGNVGAWATGQLVVGQEGATGGAIGVSYSSSNNAGYISSLSPSVAWRDLGFRAANTIFYYNGGTEGMRLNTGGTLSISSLGTGLVKATAGALSIAGAADLPSGSTNYIQNQLAGAQAANYWISGEGRANVFNFGHVDIALPTFYDGQFYRYNGQAELRVDDLFRIRDNDNVARIEFDTDQGMVKYGPNTGWSRYLRVGGSANQTDEANIAATNGNLHLDAKDGFAIYIQNYTGDNTYINPGAGNVGIGTTGASSKLEVLHNTPAMNAGSYNTGNIEVVTNNASNPSIGFHRSGYSATALYHSGYGNNSLRIRNADGFDGAVIHEGNLNTLISYQKNEYYGVFGPNNWNYVTTYSGWMDVKAGDPIKLDGMYYARATDGNNNEYFYTNVEITGQNGCGNYFANQTDYFHISESGSDHDNFKPVPYMDVWSSPCTGQIRFRLMVYLGGDDNAEVREAIITGTRY